MKHPTFDDLNSIVAQVMCGVSTSLRFPGQLNGDMRKLAMNLIPFPRVCLHLLRNGDLVANVVLQLHFLMPSYAPFFDPNQKAYSRTNVKELTTSYVEWHQWEKIWTDWMYTACSNVQICLSRVTPASGAQFLAVSDDPATDCGCTAVT